MQEMIDEKTNLNNEYQKLNKSYQQNVKEQNDLLVLCSTYEDQLSTCRNIIQSAGLTVNLMNENQIVHYVLLFRYPIFYWRWRMPNDRQVN
jgi:hypothetical protein